MSFEYLEESIEDGRPIYLYQFTLSGNQWRYTSADADIPGAGMEDPPWLAVAISDDGPKQTGDASTDALSITCTSSIVPAQIYMQYPPSSPMQVAIFITHEGETSDIKAIYAGEVTQHSNPQPGASRFTCETFSATMQREGLRLGWQRGCPYMLYDPATCKVDKAAFASTGTVSTVVGDIVTIPAFSGQADGRFRGGFLEWNDSTRGTERRAIEWNTGGTLTMFGSANGLAAGTIVTAYPGCARNAAACNSFGNFMNYGGVPAMKGESPFDGKPVFN